MTARRHSRVLGIDFGTSNSAAALVDDEGFLRVIPLEAHSPSMPTALFFPAEGDHIAYGTDAMQTYLRGAQEQDPGGRLMRAIKSLLGSKLMDEQTVVNGQLMGFFDIVVLFFKELKARSERHLGFEVRAAMLGRPVHFVDDHADRDALAQATLERAARAAGFESVSFELEPIAAAFDFERRVDRDTTVLVVDIGGGTSDFTVIQLGPDRQKNANRAADVLATTGTHIGGTDFDRLLNLGCVMPHLGLGHTGPSGREVPSSVFFDLSTWHLIHHAYSRKSLAQATELWRSYTDRRLHERLMDVLRERQGHQILAHVEEAKISCSMSSAPADIDLDCVEPGLTAALTPEHMRALLAQQVGTVVQCAKACVERAASGSAAIDVVYLTGGSSALTPLVDALNLAFPGASLVKGDRFGGVAAGLAWAGFAAGQQVQHQETSEMLL
ncbi:MAG: Hsp70 family protein [Rhodoferax sp.]|nr:Hsp70 family protein [Rhodoferax sp.]